MPGGRRVRRPRTRPRSTRTSAPTATARIRSTTTGGAKASSRPTRHRRPSSSFSATAAEVMAMADMFEFPKVEVDRERVTLYRTPFPKLTEAKVAQLAELHGMKAKPQDADSRIVFRDRVATLELFRASNSIRWSKLGGKMEVKANGRRPALPDDHAARKGAAAFLRERKVPTKGAAVDSITHAMFARGERRRKTVEEYPIAVHVNYRYELDGLPVLGPGAKIQVTYADRKGPVEMYVFWRAPKADGELTLLAPRAALALLRRDPEFAELREGDAEVIYHNARLGYYALPPRESQGALIPVYAFDGTVSTRALERYDFRRYVVAVKLTPEDAKQVD